MWWIFVPYYYPDYVYNPKIAYKNFKSDSTKRYRLRSSNNKLKQIHFGGKERWGWQTEYNPDGKIAQSIVKPTMKKIVKRA